MTCQCWYSNVSWNLWRCLEYAFQLLKGHLLTKYFGHANSVVSALKHSTTFFLLFAIQLSPGCHSGLAWLSLIAPVSRESGKEEVSRRAAIKVSISFLFGPGLCYKPQHLYDITDWGLICPQCNMLAQDLKRWAPTIDQCNTYNIHIKIKWTLQLGQINKIVQSDWFDHESPSLVLWSLTMWL